jgi:hypothetical protein
MINANELRIGNILMFTDFPQKKEMKMEGYQIDYASRDPNWLNFFFEPIPLTEEWLFKFGFVKEKHGWYSLKRGSRKTNNLKMFHLTLCESGYNTKGGIMGGYIGINSVHQLQNLYFALTGQELHP